MLITHLGSGIWSYPLAVAYQKLIPFAFFEALTFVLLLLVGYVYVLKKRVLEWA